MLHRWPIHVNWTITPIRTLQIKWNGLHFRSFYSGWIFLFLSCFTLANCQVGPSWNGIDLICRCGIHLNIILFFNNAVGEQSTQLTDNKFPVCVTVWLMQTIFSSLPLTHSFPAMSCCCCCCGTMHSISSEIVLGRITCFVTASETNSINWIEMNDTLMIVPKSP